jgi:hypothetical protein
VIVKTCINDDKLGNAYGVANTLIATPGVAGDIVALEGPIVDEKCLRDILA